MAEHVEFAVEQHFLATVTQQWHEKHIRLIKAIEPEYLQAQPYRWFIQKLQDYVAKHHAVMPWGFVDLLVQREFQDPDALEEMRRVIWLIYSMPIEWGAEAIDNFRNYLSWRIYSSGFSATRDGYRKSQDMSLALGHGQQAIERARTLLVEPEVHDLGGAFEKREAEWMLERDNPGFRNRLQLGIDALDVQLKMEEGTVTAFLAPFKRYKSIVLNHCGIAALVSGFNVLHVVYENTVEMTLDRYYSRIGSIPLDDLTAMRVDPSAYAQARQFIKNFDRCLGNRLKIIQADPQRTTVDDVEAQIEVLRVEEGFIPDVSVWDYANIIGIPPQRRAREDRLNQETGILMLREHARDIRHDGARRKIVVTAVQAKGEAIDKEHLEASDYGKSVGIPQALDALLGIMQTKQERKDGKLRFGVLASRNAKPTDEVETTCDISWMCIDLNTWAWVVDRAMAAFEKHGIG